MENSKPAFSLNPFHSPTKGPEDYSTMSVGIGQTQTDHQGRLMEDFKTQNTGSLGISRNHLENIIPHHGSSPKHGGSDIDLLVSPRELALPPIAIGSRQYTEDTNSIVSSYIMNGSGNNIILPPSSNKDKSSKLAVPHPVESVRDTSFDSKSNNYTTSPTSPTQPHSAANTDILHGQKSQGDDSLSNSHSLLDGIGLSYPEANRSNEAEIGDDKTEDRVPQIKNLMLPHQRIINSSVESPRFIKQGSFNRIHIDTAAPFESVKEAVSKFGGIVDWKAHKVQSIERRKLVEQELDKLHVEMPEYKNRLDEAEEEKFKVLKELDSAKRLIEELKVSLERAQTEEDQAKQDSELAKLRMEEREQGIADEASIAAKTQLEVAKARHEAAIVELATITDDLEALRNEYSSLIVERDVASKRAEEAVNASREVEKTVEYLTIELITTKESLESAHAAHLEAEEKRITVAMARDQDTLQWKKDLKQGEEELQRINQQVNYAKELKSKLDTASALLLDLKAELSAYKLKEKTDGHSNDELPTEIKLDTDMQAAIASAKKELGEMKNNIKKAKAEVETLKAAANSLKSELEKEKSKLDSTQSEAALLQREKTPVPLKPLQEATEEAEKAKSLAQMTREEFIKAKEEAEQAKAGASTIEIRLLAAQKEIEAANVSEKLVLAAIKALQVNESAQNIGNANSPQEITVSLEEYYQLSKRAYEAEEKIEMRMAAVNSRIEAAKKSQSKSLEKLEELNKEMAERKEAQRIATERADKANEGKLKVEQELRNWRSEHEQQQTDTEPSHGENIPPSTEEKKESDDTEPAPPPAGPTANMNDTPPEPKPKKKRKSIIPKIFMFLSRRKSKTS
ncbi:hypothetical protein Goari_003816 [Gossypium aridum]|uniref:Protein WEAK CHLOROPLAST MOVEMENT UNDER BLUE LIGHT 1-like n=1 Tax=Gossypium aridum TaxID=34290 RepID=A0A7J8Y1J6_GOSAI|nr:hypothetical protein [Gossypium aridum]